MFVIGSCFKFKLIGYGTRVRDGSRDRVTLSTRDVTAD